MIAFSRFTRTAVLLGTIVIATACAQRPIDVQNWPCENGACAAGYFCALDNICTPKLLAGQSCAGLDGTACASDHCDTGLCCNQGVCCNTASDCPASFAGASACNDLSPATDCQGTRLTAACVDNACTSVATADASACGGVVHVCANNFAPVVCTANVDQPIPACKTQCAATPDCAPGYGCTAQGQCAIPAVLSITTTVLSAGTQAAAYSAIVAVTGGLPAYGWSITAGALPAGLSLAADTGVISGTPTNAGPASFTMTVIDTNLTSASQAFNMTINPPLVMATAASLPTGTSGAAYATTLAASGGTTPYTWSITAGSLPAGLSLAANTGIISGVPISAATATFTVTATDAANAAVTQGFTLTVSPAIIISTSSPLPSGTSSTAYSAQLAASGGTTPYSWTITSGSLPAGLTLASDTGIISGSPTAPVAASFTATVTDAATASAAKTFTLIVNGPLTISSAASLPSGTSGTAYSTSLVGAGGTAPYTWSIAAGSLPAGLSLAAATGIISGTPTATATANFTLSATDAASATVSKAFSLTINPTLVISTTSPLQSGTNGAAYATTLAVIGGTTPFTWSVTAGSLPAGLLLAAATGVISGTPTSATTANFTVTVTDAAFAVVSKALSLTINPALVISTTSPLPAGTSGSAYSATLAANGGTTPYAWTITSGSLPAGLTLASDTGIISGLPTSAAALSFTATVTDAAGASVFKVFTLVVNGPLTITTASSLSSGTSGAAYSTSLIAAGGTAPYTWAITLGSLPAGLTLAASSGVISGIPTSTATANFTLTVTDAASATASKAFSLTINPALAISSTSPLPSGTSGAPYSTTLAPSGGTTPYTWSITSGSLPAGLLLTTDTGIISGTPTNVITANLTVTLSDAAFAVVSKALSLTINPVPTISTASPLPTGTDGASYSTTLAASGGTTPFTWSVTVGSLPAGLSLAAATGVISGTPTTATTVGFTVTATDAAAATVSKAFSLTMNPPLTISTTSPLPAGTDGTFYSTTLVASGGTAPFTWSVTVGSLPAGLSLATATGVISGSPTSAATASFTITATDAAAAAAPKALSLTINPSLAISTTSPLPPGSNGAAYSTTLVATGGTIPFTWSITSGSLPAGLSLAPATGVISGTPSSPATANFTATITDAASASASKGFSLTINAVLAITTTSPLPGGTIGTAYTSTLAASGGASPYTFAITAGSLPAGLSLWPATGVISGTPTAIGTSAFTATVTDAVLATAFKAFSLTINVMPAISTASPLPAGTNGAAYSTTLAATDGTTPYTWSITGGSLPAGLSLAAVTGVISGTPTSAGPANFTVTLTDAAMATVSKAFSLTINPVLTISTVSPLPGGTNGTAYSTTLVASGGTVAYTWSVTIGSLPAGLSLAAATGVISGTPTATGTVNFTATVTDAAMAVVSKAFSLTINAALGISTASPLASWTMGRAYSTTLTATGGTSPFTWTITGGALPAGLSLAAATGVISGTPTAAGTANFTVTVTDTALATAAKAFSLTINPVPAISTTSPLPSWTLGKAYSTTLAATGGTTPYTWSISVGSLPAGLTLAAATGVISGTPTTAGTANFTVTLTDAATATTAQAFSLTINAVPVISTASPLPAGTNGAAYSMTLAATGGTAPLSWSVTVGSLPAGLSLAAATGVISGTPSTAVTANFTVTVTDAAAAIASKAFSLTINAALGISTASPLASWTMGRAYSTTLTATGGTSPFSWTITAGALPAGLSLAAATGVISGTPTAAGPANFTATVTDTALATAAKAFSLTINPVPAISTTSPLPSWTLGKAYSTTLVATGGTTPYTWSISAGLLPAGLTLAAATGVISGTPTTAGIANFTVTLTDAASATTAQAFVLTINAVPAISTASPLPAGTNGAAYSTTLAATGGTTPLTWSITVGSLPAGLSLAAATGTISGTPTGTGTANFTVTATDAASVIASKAFVLTINAALGISTASPLASWTIGKAYSTTLAATGGTSPFTWTITGGALPAGLSLATATGVISGTPTAAGPANFTATVTDTALATAAKAFSLTINPAPAISTASPLPSWTLGKAYSTTLGATGGTTPYTWSISAGSLPAGLTLAAATGVISGTPTTAGTANFTATVTDAALATASKAFSLTINAVPAISTASPLPAGTNGAAYSTTLAATGGTAPLSWSITVGSLPAGLSLAAATGVISGTPTGTGTANFTVTVTDAAAATASKAFSLTINAALGISTASPLASWTMGKAYSTTLAATGGTSPFSWTITAGALPAGLSLAAATGVISGTPTAAGTANFTATVTDAALATASKAFSLTINPVPAILTTSPLPGGMNSTAYSTTLTASGGTTPYTWSITAGSLPAGLTLAAATGIISGTPTGTGVANFTATVTDAATVTASQAFSLTIVPKLTVTTASPLPGGTNGTAYSTTLVASGGTTPYTWSVTAGSLPVGLSLAAATGVISGTPTGTGIANFTVTVTDAALATASKALSLTISAAPAITTTSPLPAGTSGAAYSTTIVATGGTAPFSWSITGGSLPAGLSLAAATGVISGTPTGTGIANFTVTLTDAATATAAQAFSLTINPALAITTTSPLPPWTIGVAYSTTLAASGGTTPYTWTITVGSLPAGLSLAAATGVISGTPTAAGTANFTVTLTDAAFASLPKVFSLTINAVLTVATASPLPGGTIGMAYSTTLAAGGGTAPLSWSITAGALPAGLSLAATGVISGTPTGTGTASFTVTVTDAATASASKALSLTINPLPSITTTSPLATGDVGAVYSTTLAASGGTTPYAWSITLGSLPAGLSLAAATGVISGTPTAATTANFTITLTDAAAATASQAFSLTINPPLAITTTSPLPPWTSGVAYSTTLAASGGTTPYAWSITLGSLPAGLSLAAATGVISGTPTAAGTANFTITLTDAALATAAKAFTLTINAVLAISTASPLPGGTIGTAYSTTVAASGGTAPLSWSITAGALPGEFYLAAGTGVVSGTPLALEVATFMVTVTDAAMASASKLFTLTINPLPSITTTSPLTSGEVGSAYSTTLAGSSGTTPYAWSITLGSLPAGLSLAAATGVISGTPTTAITANFTITLTDAATATASQAFSLTIIPALVITTASPLVGGTVATAYSTTLAATGGVPPYTWNIISGALPAGLSLTVATGVIAGTPTAFGPAVFTVQVTDAISGTVAKTFVLRVVQPVAFDAVGPGVGGAFVTNSASLSWTHVMGGGPAGLLTVGVALGTNANDGTLTLSVTYNGIAMTSLAKEHSNNGTRGYSQLFYLVNPPSGSHTVAVTIAGGNADLEGGSVSFTGVDPTVPLRNATLAAGSNTTATVSVPSAAGDMVVDVVVSANAITSSAKTLQWKKNQNTNSWGGNGAQSTAAGAASVTMSYTITSGAWGIVGADVVEAGSTLGPTIDVNVSADNPTTASTSITSPAFSTSASSELLLAFVSASGGGQTVTSLTTAGLTWVMVKRTNAQTGTAEIWRAFASAPVTSVTAAVSLQTSCTSSVTVMGFRGVDISGANGSGAIGAVGTGNSGSGAPTASLTTTRNNSLVLGIGYDGSNNTGRTLGANQTLIHQFLDTNPVTIGWAQRQQAPTPLSGTVVTINDTAPNNEKFDLSIVEVLTPP